jgi:alkanesulfonate monooxygenase SsuD/methylene tetrahydromethanopterin reductase-like flavin-dependent oxidoreductase (luciferase family)
MVTASLHFWWELYQQSGSDAFIRAEVRDVWDRYLAYVERMPERELHLRVHDGHCTYLVPEERQFVTPEMIRASGGLVGEPDEIIAMLRAQERGGLKEVTLLPPMEYARECYADFARHVIERY